MNTRVWQMVEGGLVGAACLAGTIALDLPWWLPLALFLAWDLSALGYLAGPRVGVDRALGYGLKHSDSFQHTHLGWIGKAREGAEPAH